MIGRVEHVHVDDAVLDAAGRLDLLKVRPIARLGYHDYTCVDNVFEMVPPGASAAELAGLAGVTVAEDPAGAQS